MFKTHVKLTLDLEQLMNGYDMTTKSVFVINRLLSVNNFNGTIPRSYGNLKNLTDL